MSLRDRFATCPRCGGALDERGDRAICAPCGGALVAEARISQMIATILGDQISRLGWSGKIAEPQPLALEPRDDGEGLTCPRCATTMSAVALYGIKVDRCDAHGLWFDRDELEDVLARAPAANPVPVVGSERVFMGIVGVVVLAAELLRMIAI